MGRKIIAIANQKGGVAKTTTAVNLAAGLANLECRVLLIDSDPQGNATSHLGFQSEEIEYSLDNLYYEEDLSIHDVILGRGTLDFIPAGEPLAYADRQLGGIPGSDQILREKIEEGEIEYDYVIIDCPPNLGILTINAFSAATDMIISIKPEFFALEGLKRISGVLKQVQKRLNSDLNILGYLLANYDARKNQHKGVRQTIDKVYGDGAFKTVIRTNSKLSDCTSRGETIFEHDPKGPGAIDYLNLAKEVQGRNGR